MEKIIIRKDTLQLGFLSTALNYFTDKKYKSKKKLIEDFGYDKLLKGLFDEKTETYENLYQSYNELVNSGKIENEYFVVAYRIDEEFCVALTQNIYLYRLPLKDKILSKIVPWYYADSKKYIGDTWWETDEEILQNIHQLSLIEFLKRYKGYIG